MKNPIVLILGIIVLATLGCNRQLHNTSSNIQISENVDLSRLDFLKDYQIVSNEFGTRTTVNIIKGERIMTTNALPNHETGKFPNKANPNRISAQRLSYSFPVNPVFSGEIRWAREPGVAVNGIKFEPETAERFVCETGEVYKIEAIQDLVDLGLDFNHAHVQPTGAYHYHGAPKELLKQLDSGSDIILIGFAKDGFPMYYSKSGKYKPSYVVSEDLRTGEICEYRNPKQRMEENFNETRPDGTFVSDWTYVEGYGDLDECNGTMVNGVYGYFVTNEYPYVSRCLKGVFEEEHRHRSIPGSHSHRPLRRAHNH